MIFLEILFAASDKRSPKVAAPQADLHLFGLIAKVISKIIEKQGYSAKVSLHELTMTHADDDGNVHVHLDLHLDASEKDIRKLLNML